MTSLSRNALTEAITAAQARDQAAFNILYEHYTDAVFRYLYARCGDPLLAEHMVGDFWLRVVQHIANVRLPREGAERAFTVWLYRIAQNLAFNHQRSSRPQHSPSKADRSAAEPEPEEALIEQEQRAELYQALSELTPDQREVLILRFFEGYTGAEVAAQTERTERAARAMQYRALGSMARLLSLVRKVEGK